MANNYVKSLKNFTYIQDELYLTIDGNESSTYTYAQIIKLGIKDEEWVSRSVALSMECSLSVAAIFRPFRNVLPYAQFIGRILRYIPEGEDVNDNIGEIISHHALGIDELWETYKVEIQESEIIKHLSGINYLDSFDSDDEKAGGSHDTSVGKATDINHGILKEDIYLTTELIKKSKQAQEDFDKKVEELVKLLQISKEQLKCPPMSRHKKANLS